MYQGEEQTSERLMTVGELACRTGMSAKAIRQFEGLGLIYSAGRSEANYRLFDESAIWSSATSARSDSRSRRSSSSRPSTSTGQANRSGRGWPRCSTARNSESSSGARSSTASSAVSATSVLRTAQPLPAAPT
jgi:hypothetical protein